jgi:hypothetical protein
VLTFLQGQLASASEPREQNPEPEKVPETQTSG